MAILLEVGNLLGFERYTADSSKRSDILGMNLGDKAMLREILPFTYHLHIDWDPLSPAIISSSALVANSGITGAEKPGICNLNESDQEPIIFWCLFSVLRKHDQPPSLIVKSPYGCTMRMASAPSAKDRAGSAKMMEAKA